MGLTMKHHYFLAASLPALHFGREPELDSKNFEKLAEDNLSEREFNFLQDLRSYDIREKKTHHLSFLRNYFQFESEVRLILTTLRAKKLRRDLLSELQYEDLFDPLVAQILSQKDVKNYTPPEEYLSLKELFDRLQDSPLELQKALFIYRFEKIESLLGIEEFTLNRIVGYLAQLILIEKWLQLDKKKGLEVIDRIVKELS